MTHERLTQLKRLINGIRDPLELDGFCEQLAIQNEFNGVMRHLYKVRYEELRGKRK